MASGTVTGFFYDVRIMEGEHKSNEDYGKKSLACFIGCNGGQGLDQGQFKQLFEDNGFTAYCRGLNKSSEKPPVKTLTLEQVSERMEAALKRWPVNGGCVFADKSQVCTYVDIAIYCVKEGILTGPDVAVRVEALKLQRDQIAERKETDKKERENMKREQERRQKEIKENESREKERKNEEKGNEENESAKEKTGKQRDEKNIKGGEESIGKTGTDKGQGEGTGKHSTKQVRFKKGKEVFSQEEIGQDKYSQDMFSQSQDTVVPIEDSVVTVSTSSRKMPAEDTMERIDADFEDIKEDVLYQAEDANTIITRLRNIVKKEQAKTKEIEDKLVNMSANNDLLQRKELDLSGAAGQELASRLIQSLERRLDKMEAKVTSSEVVMASQFAEQNRILESLVITLSSSKNENIEGFTDISTKLSIISNTASSSQEALALTVEHERSATDALVKKEASVLKSDISSISSKLDELCLGLKPLPANIPAKASAPSLPPCDLSKPPPPLKKAGPISTMGIYREDRERSRSMSSRRSRSRARNTGRSSHRSRSRFSARDRSISSEEAIRIRSRSRVRDRSSSRSRTAKRSRSRAVSNPRAESRSRALSRPPSRSRSRSREQRSSTGQEREDRSVSYCESPLAPFRGSNVVGYSSRDRGWSYGPDNRTPGLFESQMYGSRWKELGGQFRGKGDYSEGRGAARSVTHGEARGRNGAGGRGRGRGRDRGAF